MLPAKRTRAASVGENNEEQLVLQQTPQHIPKIFRPSFIHRSPNYMSNLNGNGTLTPNTQPLSTKPTQKVERIAIPVVGANTPFHPSTSVEKKSISEHAHTAVLTPINPKPSASPPHQLHSTVEQAPVYSQSTSEASGLDFLASTASLLAPIVQRPAASSFVSEASSSNSNATSSIVVQITNSQPASILQTDDTIPPSATGLVTEQLRSKQATECSQPGTSRSIKTVSQPAKTSIPDQTAQDFLKQHALKNGEIDEATTLGSILADPALRSKLFLSAAKSNSSLSSSSSKTHRLQNISDSQQAHTIKTTNQATNSLEGEPTL